MPTSSTGTAGSPSEYGGADAGQRRPDGSLRHAGQPMTHSPSKAKDLRRNIMLSGDESGDTAPDPQFHGEGLSKERFDEINRLQKDPRTAANPLMDP